MLDFIESPAFQSYSRLYPNAHDFAMRKCSPTDNPRNYLFYFWYALPDASYIRNHMAWGPLTDILDNYDEDAGLPT